MLKTTGNKNLNGHRVNGRLLAAAFAVAAGFDAQASIISPVVKAGERVVARVLPHATAPAVRGGTKLAAVTAERAAQLQTAPSASLMSRSVSGSGTAVLLAAAVWAARA